MKLPQESRSFRKQNPKWRGFTIMELLIVVVVIAILAAIVVVAYNGVTNGAREASLKSDLKNAAGELTLHELRNKKYPDSADGLSRSNDTEYAYSPTTDGYCLAASNTDRSIGPFRIIDGGKIEDGKCPIVVTAIAAGSAHICALVGGSVYCWGNNRHYGQLGDGTTMGRSTPVPVDMSGVLSGKTVTDIVAGGDHTCVLASGDIYCWGRNLNGELGDGTTTSRSTPVAVDMSGVLSGKTVTDIVTGFANTCALTSSGGAYCWGYNGNGQLGDGTTTSRSTPVAVDTSGVLSGRAVAAIAVGRDHACALAGGGAYCWGANNKGQLGDKTTLQRLTPRAVDTNGELNGQAVTVIAAGRQHTCALTGGGAYCWGLGNYDQLGNGATGDRTTPVAVDTSGELSGKVVTAIGAGNIHTCGLAGGGAYCWGYNVNSQLGDGSTTTRSTPVAVDASGALKGKAVTAIAVGGNSACTLASGKVHCWGTNSDGQLGDGSTTNRSNPVAVSPFPEI